MARVQRQRTRHQEAFPIKEHGSWEFAEKAADVWIRRMERTLPPPITAKNLMTRRNSSGVVGVHPRHEVIRKASGKEYEYYYWVSRWPGCRLKAGVKWAIHTFGDDDAFVLAVLCREMEVDSRERVIDEFMTAMDDDRYRQILVRRKQT
ncbi:MAG: hypothetical protein ACR2NX_03200 [Chthoniobacterales bacterium]